jgi:hypothetical protein
MTRKELLIKTGQMAAEKNMNDFKFQIADGEYHHLNKLMAQYQLEAEQQIILDAYQSTVDAVLLQELCV